MASEQAREDLRDKIRLEKSLIGNLNTINRKIIDTARREFAQSGTAANADNFRDPITDTLEKHYKKTSDVFAVKMSKELPSDIEETDEERDIIDNALGLAFLARSGDQGQIITNTNQRDINESVIAAEQQAIETSAETGEFVTRLDTAVLIGVLLNRKLAGRVGMIAMTETQLSAELSKGTEVEVLSGQDPSVLVGSNRESFVDKEWVTMGDEKVRESHMIADGQVTDLNSSFIVDNEALRWPGDSSLGASAGNVINCRCASVYDKNTVFSVRRRSNELLSDIQESL